LFQILVVSWHFHFTR